MCNEDNNLPYILCLDCSDNSMYIDINIPKNEKINWVEILNQREYNNGQQIIFSNIINNVGLFLSRSQKKESKKFLFLKKRKSIYIKGDFQRRNNLSPLFFKNPLPTASK